MHTTHEGSRFVDSRTLRASNLTHLVVNTIKLRIHAHGLATCRYVGSHTLIEILDVTAGVVLHHAAVLIVRACSHLVPLEAQLLLIVFHFQVDRARAQFVQPLTRVHHVFDFLDYVVVVCSSCIVDFPLIVLLVLHIR